MWHPVCWSWVGKLLSEQRQQLHTFLYRLSRCGVLTQKCISQNIFSPIWACLENIAFPLSGFHSFTPPHPPSSLLSVPPSVSSWHVGSLPDHQPVSSDSLVWQSSSSKEALQQTYTTTVSLYSCPKDKAFYRESMSANTAAFSAIKLSAVKPVTWFHSEYFQ